MTSDHHENDDTSRPLLGALCEGGVVFVVALAFMGIFAIREALHGANAFRDGWPLLVVIPLATGMFFGYMAYLRIRRMDKLRIRRALCPEKDALAATCIAAYPDGLDDVTAALPVDPCLPIQIVKVLEERTWNVHRVIVLLRTATECLDMAKVKVETAKWVKANLRGRWMRGLGLGMVLRCRNLRVDMEDLYEIVAGSGGPTVILQWIVLVDEGMKRVLAVHMPVPGKTTTCFVAVVTRLAEDGYRLEMALKERTGMYRKLSAFEKIIPPWLHAIVSFLH